MTPHPFSLATPTHILYEDKGVSLVELFFTPRGFGEIHPLILDYYTAYLATLDKLCREVLLPKRGATYEADIDPRKRFTYHRLCLSLTLVARQDLGHLTVKRTLTLSLGTEKTTHLVGEVFSLDTGKCIPLSHFAGKHPRLQETKKRAKKNALRYGYTLKEGNPYLLHPTGQIPLMLKPLESKDKELP